VAIWWVQLHPAHPAPPPPPLPAHLPTTKIKALKDIVSAMIRSLPMLGDVIILAMFFFAVFGVFGLEIFKVRKQQLGA
jgi:hypothetical protein